MKVTVQHYPAQNLPDDVRGEIAPEAAVNITLETVDDSEAAVGSLLDIVGAADAVPLHATPAAANEALQAIREQWA